MYSIQLLYNSQAKKIIFALEQNASNKIYFYEEIILPTFRSWKNIYRKPYCSIFHLHKTMCLRFMIHWILYLCVQLQQSVPIHKF